MSRDVETRAQMPVISPWPCSGDRQMKRRHARSWLRKAGRWVAAPRTGRGGFELTPGWAGPRAAFSVPRRRCRCSETAAASGFLVLQPILCNGGCGGG